MRIGKTEWDKLTDTEKIKINSYFGIQTSYANTAVLCSMTSILFSIHNILLGNIDASFIFTIISLLFFITSFHIKQKSINQITNDYFKVEVKKIKRGIK